MTTLIQATSTTPEITTEWLHETAVDDAGLTHARDVIAQCASQVGDDACADACRELDRIEARLYAV